MLNAVAMSGGDGIGDEGDVTRQGAICKTSRTEKTVRDVCIQRC